MMKRWFAVVVVAALALTLADAGTSHAQRWGRYVPGYGSGYGYSPYGMGLGTGYNVSGYLPNTFAYGNYASWPNTYGYTTQYGMSPYYGGSYAYGTPAYYGGSYAYGTPTYTGGVTYAYGTPTYTGGTLYSPSSYATMPQNYVSFYPPNFPQGSPTVGSTTSNDQALIEVRCPPDAEILFDGEETRQRGTDRRLFTSPPLEPGKRYHYDVEARWNQDGRTVKKTHTVPVRAGQPVTVDFLSGGSDRDGERRQDRDLDRDRDRTKDRDLDRDRDRTRDRDQDRNRDRNPDRNRDRNPER